MIEPKLSTEANELKLFEQFVFPLYYFDQNRKPEKWATGFIVELKKQFFLVTAAHARVEKAQAKGPLFYFYDHDKTVSIGTMTMTQPNPVTGVDRWDLAVAKLPEGGGPPYSALNKKAIRFDQLVPSLLPRSSWNYVAVGFPNAKNKVYEPAIKGRALAISSNSPPQTVYDSMNLDEQHLLIQYDRNFQGKGQILPKLKGMSGGPIFAVSDDQNLLTPDEVKVVAVSTDYFEDKKLIQGTDVISLRFMIESLSNSTR